MAPRRPRGTASSLHLILGERGLLFSRRLRFTGRGQRAAFLLWILLVNDDITLQTKMAEESSYSRNATWARSSEHHPCAQNPQQRGCESSGILGGRPSTDKVRGDGERRESPKRPQVPCDRKRTGEEAGGGGRGWCEGLRREVGCGSCSGHRGAVPGSGLGFTVEEPTRGLLPTDALPGARPPSGRPDPAVRALARSAACTVSACSASPSPSTSWGAPSSPSVRGVLLSRFPPGGGNLMLEATPSGATGFCVDGQSTRAALVSS